MGPSAMNCFEWQNRASDYLDGTLIGTVKRQADQHLEACEPCSSRHKNYRLILTSLASQPRAALPIPLRKTPFTSALPRLELSRLGRSRWEQIPWYIRTTIEGTSIVFLILLGISFGPKLRMLYERNIEKNFGDFADSLSEPNSETAALNLPLSRGKPTTDVSQTDRTQSAAETTNNADEFASSEEEGGTEQEESSTTDHLEISDDTDVHVGSSEIWRFNFKTDSPHEFRSRIVQTLSDLKIPSNTKGLGGIEAPGGIQFDLMLPQSVVAQLKRQLQKLVPTSPEDHTSALSSEPFTWYKSKTKKPLPLGQTHVVIWLSQM